MKRTIKSYVLRAGRISNRQQQALEQSLPDYELTLTGEPWNLSSLFNREVPTIVEIGFGMGDSLLMMAKLHPETNFIGIEVHRAGLGSFAAAIKENDLANVRIVNHDAVAIFAHQFLPESLAGIQIFFPDPWPKKRHQKRRLIQAKFLDLVVPSLKKGGFIHCATDWQDYAEQMLQVLSADSRLVNTIKEGDYVPRPSTRPLTKFERRGQQLGHGVWDLIFTKC